MEISDEVAEHFNIKFSEQEVHEPSLLRSRTTRLDFKNLGINDLFKEFGQESYNLTKKPVQEVNSIYYVNLDDDDFMTKSALHINNLLIRHSANYPNRNPLTQRFRNVTQ